MPERKFKPQEMRRMAAGRCVAKLLGIRDRLSCKDADGVVTLADVDDALNEAWDHMCVMLNSLGDGAEKVADQYSKLREWNEQ